MSNLINFKNAIIGTGGASYNLLTGEFNPTTGFMVSIKDHEERSKFNVNNLQYTIARYIRVKADLLLSGESEELFLGAWVEDDILVLDVSLHIESREEAIRVAILNNQIAYYDCNIGKEVYL